MVLFGLFLGYVRVSIFQRQGSVSIAWALVCFLHSTLWAQQSIAPANTLTVGISAAVATVVATPRVIATPERSLVLSSQVGAFSLPLAGSLDPETIWQPPQTITQPANAQGVWTLHAGQRIATKFSITTKNERVATLEFPMVRLDKADVFWRIPGKPWQHAQAGDTVALSQWPVLGQHPTFMLHFDGMPGQIDVVAVLQNDGFGEVSALLSSDLAARENHMLQASLAGLLIGASVLALVMSLLLLAMSRSAAYIHLVVFCACVCLAALALTGYLAIWFTPEWPRFNDSMKSFTGTAASATMLTTAVFALDRGAVGAKWRLAVLGTALLLLGYAVAQQWVLPHSWRLMANLGIGVLLTVMGISMSMYSWRRGDRFALWVLLSIVLFALCAIVFRSFVTTSGVDVFSTGVIACMIASSLALGHVLTLRERFGKAVIGRAATHRYRDPLTALLSYEGLEREVEHLAVRQQTGGGAAHVLYFSLQALDSFKHEDGYLVWQRDLVRFAAVLQKVLGEDWHIARLSNSKFGAVRLQGRQKIAPEQLLTLVLTSCSRKIDTHDWVDRVGLRMAATSALLGRKALPELVTTLDQDLQNLAPGKRIAVV
jgi:two-component system, sensor histidine kinase LadS